MRPPTPVVLLHVHPARLGPWPPVGRGARIVPAPQQAAEPAEARLREALHDRIDAWRLEVSESRLPHVAELSRAGWSPCATCPRAGTGWHSACPPAPRAPAGPHDDLCSTPAGASSAPPCTTTMSPGGPWATVDATPTDAELCSAASGCGRQAASRARALALALDDLAAPGPQGAPARGQGMGLGLWPQRGTGPLLGAEEGVTHGRFEPLFAAAARGQLTHTQVFTALTVGVVVGACVAAASWTPAPAGC